MLAEKYSIQKTTTVTRSAHLKNKIEAIKNWDPERLVGRLSDALFKCVLFFAIPYFIYVLIKFLTL
ncbi:hypothetical protein JOD43_001587 [Pullulanibacillus pueri]|uniref:Uncharacterized protein n=1 Tax=Pullulanibacillus pueri TaxID=1437324 RepID=A0A8J3EKX7_9BACL|nr:hypothetical protein [Pullulanibacillus pueri]MBM7681420.1 hypothetical protein [Pullulanibacillus pueri]GGH78806.1 hypothetical protein GCM10007096_12790 [Pullulanibacillus pueri]